LFNEIIPGIIDLAKQLESLLPSLELLKAGRNYSIELSKKQIASLLANAFLCTFPYRNDQSAGKKFEKYPSINFNS
jgi:poly(ADP-ribose) glycohydrolase